MTPAPAETLKLLPESTPVLRFVYISAMNPTLCGLHHIRQKRPRNYFAISGKIDTSKIMFKKSKKLVLIKFE